MSFLSAALCSSAVFIFHHSDLRARVYFCRILQTSLYASTADLVLLICNTLWWALSLIAIKLHSIWSFWLNQSWCFLSCFPRDALVVSYTTCWNQVLIGSVHCPIPAPGSPHSWWFSVYLCSVLSASTLSNHVLLGLPTLNFIHFFTQSSLLFLIRSPYHLSLPLLMTVVIGSTPTILLNSSFLLLSFMDIPHIHLNICISALSNFNPTSISKGIVSLP